MTHPSTGTAPVARGEPLTSAERFYFEGLEEGLRRREAEVITLRTRLDQAGFEIAQLKLQNQSTKENQAPRDPEAALSDDTSSNDSSSFIRVPPPSHSGLMSFPPRAVSPAFRPSPSNNRYGIPNYLSVFRSCEAETALKELMEKARSMDARALTRIKSMCREAHATPRDSKSWAQSFILSEWRNPPELAPPNIRDPTQPVLPNPRMGDSFESWFEYYSIHSSCLPRGVRKDAQGKPWKPDLRASRLAAQLRPLQTSPTVTRTEFNYYLIELLGTSGDYHRMVSRRGLRIATKLSPRPYDGPSPVTIEDVVLHMANCGITVETTRDDLEPWSHQYKAGGTRVLGPKFA
ncbi:hypothetical protein VNI00_014732 [Paramarasmius palmivorus]|uniref:Uncharacterized protein n=1 Tax=Paramarasmius palmivorus TaxID=297713 RepID=A0AAW0BQK6_9AGAR